jgi:hypothetical protein
MAAVIDSVKRATLWPRPHVAQKCREVFAPLFAHVNALGSVIPIAGAARIVASVFSLPPRAICRGERRSVSNGHAPPPLARIKTRALASATGRISITQMAPSYHGRAATVADALPCWHTHAAWRGVSSGAPDDRQHPKSTAAQIDKFTHTQLYKVGRFFAKDVKP